MAPMNQIVLFVICGYLWFPMADALQCRLCLSFGPGAPCLPAIQCTAKPGAQTCHAFKTYLDGDLQQKILGCKPRASAGCGTVEVTEASGVLIEHACCEDSDFCNEHI